MPSGTVLFIPVMPAKAGIQIQINAAKAATTHKRYEFGAKASIATTSKDNWIVGAEPLFGNPYDGHTLTGTLPQIKRLTGFTPPFAVKVTAAMDMPGRPRFTVRSEKLP